MPAPDVEAQLLALKQDYAQRLPERVAALRAQTVSLASAWDDAAALELRRLLHNLAGSGASYDLPKVSASARSAEFALAALIEERARRVAHGFAPLHAALDELQAAATAPR